MDLQLIRSYNDSGELLTIQSIGTITVHQDALGTTKKTVLEEKGQHKHTPTAQSGL